MKTHYSLPCPTPRTGSRVLLLLTVLLGLATTYAHSVNSISVVNPTCNQIYPTGTYSVKVNYSADQTSTIVVFLLSAAPGYAYQGEGRVTVPAGAGTAIVNVTVSGTAAPGTGYGFYAKLRNMGGTEVASGSGGSVSVVTNPGKTNAINITNYPASIAAATAGNYYDITVNFTANQQGKVVVTLENEIFTVKGRGEYAFNGCGTGTGPVSQTVRVTLTEFTTPNSTYNLFAKVLDENDAQKAFTGQTITVTGSAPGSPRTFYVSPTGNNTNNGTSLATPFQTIQHAASQTYPGDVVQVLPGTYSSPNPPILAALTIFRSGTAAQPIVYKAYDAANRPKIKVSQGGGIFSSASYIEINGFVVEGGAAEIDPAYAQYLYDNDPNNKYIDATGIGVAYNGFISYCTYPHHVKILNNEVYNLAGNGIGTVRADYVTISGNRSHDNAKWGPYANSGISVFQGRDIDANTGYKYVISNNVSYNNYNNFPNIAITPRVVTDGNGIIIDDFRNTQNTDPNCPRPPQPYLYTGKVLVFNNLTYNNGGSGIHAYESNNVDIVHNVAYKNGTHPDLGGEIFSNTGKNVRILNNILYANATEIVNFDFGNDATVLYDYNLYYNGTANPSYGRPLASNVIADPLFVNPAARDFHLQAGSPAINSGSTLVTDPLLARDYDNNTRPSAGTLPDRGAFETATGGPGNLTVQAESFCLQSGLTAWSTGIGDFSPGDYAKYCAVNLGTGYNRLTFNLATTLTGTLFVRLGSPTGTTVGTLNFTSTGAWGTYGQQTITLSGATGTQDVYLVGSSGTLNLDWLQFSNVAVTSLTVQAESFCTQTGLTAWSTGIGDFSPGDYAKYCAVSLGTGYNRLTFHVGTVLTGTIYVRLDSPTGTTVGTFNFASTGDWGTYQEQTITLTGATGTRDVYLVGGSGTLNLDWVRFSNSGGARFAGEGNASGRHAGALAAYPNPARTVLHIPLPAGHRGAGRVVLTDVLGRRVLAEAATPAGDRGEMQLDVSRVGKGTYLLTLTHDGGRQVSRVAIVK